MKICTVLFVLTFNISLANSILIPMDNAQKNHLKAYGVAYFALTKEVEVDWLLNYRGGSFLIAYSPLIANECMVRGVSFERVSAVATNMILKEIESPAVNMNVVRMERAPRVAVYSPKNEFILDETDAVINVLDFAEIPYTLIYDEEILKDELVKYDWVHLHHEDFTGQEEKLIRRESARIEIEFQQATAQRFGYAKISEMKMAVAKQIKAFCAGGGYLFAMCSAAETLDVALAAEGTNLHDNTDDEGASHPETAGKLDFNKTLAFENFTLEPGYSRRFSDINTGRLSYIERANSFFTLFQFSAKYDIVPALLVQNHERIIREFHGLTTAFNKLTVKPTALILGENTNQNNVRYIYGELGRGHWTFYSGHDPEGSPGRWREAADLNLFPDSPGYRLILNNVLFPSAQKKKQKT